MKTDITSFVDKFPNYQQVKVEKHKPGVMTSEINICTRKWEVINLDLSQDYPVVAHNMTQFR